ncbi:MAG: hypothetical protein ACRDN0_00265, partial [Trebonia sp.]
VWVAKSGLQTIATNPKPRDVGLARTRRAACLHRIPEIGRKATIPGFRISHWKISRLARK